MADPLSIASGIAGLVALTATILSTGYRVCSQMKQHSENLNSLLNEVACFSGILVGLQSHIGEQQRSSTRATQRNGYFFFTQPCSDATEECKAILQKIQKLLDKVRKMKSVIRPIRWQFEQDEAKELINQLERYKSTFILWFQVEHGARSKELNNLETKIIAELDAIRAEQEKAQRQAELELKFAKRSKVLKWLGTNTVVKHNDTVAVRHEDSGKWLLNTPQFSDWISADSSSFFWLNGIPGSGKTVLVSTVINQIQDFYHADAGVGLCYYYCDFARDQSLSPARLVGSLLAQLLQQETLWEMVEERLLNIFNEYELKSSYPKFQDLEDLLMEIAQALTSTVLIIDALDEVPNRAEIIAFLLRLIGFEGDVKLFVASRSEPDLEDAFESFGSITIRGDNIEADVERYIRSRISQSRWKNSKESEDVVNTLTQKADGMFLWVHCQLDELCKVRTMIGLESLRGLPRSLESTYQGILSKVDGVDKELARRILQFIMFSNRPLDISELVDAIAIEDDSACLKDLEKLKLHRPEDIFEICGSLIRCSESTRTLKLAHHSVGEFLATPVLEHGVVNQFYMLESECFFQLAKSCLKYLNLKDFGSREFPIYGDQEDSLEMREDSHESILDRPFLDYAATHWLSHADRIKSGEFPSYGDQLDRVGRDKLWPDIENLFSSNTGNFLYWTSVLRYAHGEYKYPLSIKPLHICAIHNLRDEAKRLLVQGHQCNDTTPDQRNALHLALENRNTEMVQLLIKAGAPLEKANVSGRRPLHLEIESGNGQAVKILVEAGASVTAPLPDRDFPLSIAVENGLHELVPILLKKADLNSCLPDGLSMLHLAAELGHEAIARQILDYKMDPNRPDSNGWAPIHFSAHHGHVQITELLLRSDADGIACDVNGWTPLHAAIYRRHLDCATRLLEWRAKRVVSTGTILPHRPAAGTTSSNVWSSRHHGPSRVAAPRPSNRLSSTSLTGSPGNTSTSPGGFSVDGRYSLQPHRRQRSIYTPSSSLPSGPPSSRLTNTTLFGGSESSSGGEGRGSGVSRSLRLTGKYALDHESRTPMTRSQPDTPARTETSKTKMSTPLFIAVSNSFSAGIELLFRYTPDLSDMSECLDSAISPTELPILELLLRKATDADTNNTLQKVAKGRSPRAHLVCLKAYHIYHQGSHPINAAVNGKYYEVLKLALQESQDKLPHESSYVCEGFESAVKSSNFEAATLLREYGGANTIDQVSNGTTLLHAVVKARNDKAVDFLIKSGAKLDIPDQNGCLPLHLAVESNQVSTVKHLLSHDSSINISTMDKMGQTAFHIASKRNLQPIMEMMISHDSSIIEAVDYHGRTALHLAAEQDYWTAFGRRTALELLLESGAQIEAKDSIGETALYKASDYGSEPLVSILLRKGASLGQKDESGLILLQRAIEHKHESLIRLFLKNGFNIVVRRNQSVDLEDRNILMSGQRAGARATYDFQMTVLHRGNPDSASTRSRSEIKRYGFWNHPFTLGGLQRRRGGNPSVTCAGCGHRRRRQEQRDGLALGGLRTRVGKRRLTVQCKPGTRQLLICCKLKL